MTNQGKKEGTTESSALGMLAGVASFAVVYFGARLLPTETRFQIYGGIVAGAVVGLIPFFVGKKRGKQKLGAGAFLTCVICGAVFGLLLALPLAVAATILIFVTSRDPHSPVRPGAEQGASDGRQPSLRSGVDSDG